MREHRAWQKDIMTKIKLRDAAIGALPENIRAAALELDLELFPANRQIFTDTPPHDQDTLNDQMAQDQKARSRRIGTKT